MPLPFTHLHALEVRNALELGVFRGQLTSLDSRSAWLDLQTDIRSGRLSRTAQNWSLAFRFARFVSRRHTSMIGARAIDILHVASARLSRANGFFSFDARQRAVAAMLGFSVRP